MQRDIAKTIFAAVAAVYFLSIAYAPLSGSFLDLVDLPIHEAGHIFFRPLGRFMTVAGGSLFQVLVPLVFFGYFVYHEKPFSASIVLFWVGQSILNVFVYAQDAVVMKLVLLGGLTGSEGGFHDWNYLLTATGLLDHTKLVAGLIRLAGTIIIFAAIAGSFLYAVKEEKILTDTEL
jgi:hypothetical protein